MTINNTGMPIVNISPDNQAVTGGRVFADFAASGSGNALAPGEKLWMRFIFRTGSGTAETMRQDAGIAPPFHHLLDRRQ